MPNPSAETEAAPAVPLVGSFRRLAAALIAGAVLITAAVVYTLGWQGAALSMPMLLVVVAALASAAALVELIGYRTKPLEVGTTRDDARTRSATEYQERAILRFALIEGALLVSVAAAFVLGDGVVVPLLLAGAGTVSLMLVHVYPRERSLTRMEESLERGGVPSYLREAMYGQDR